MNYLPDELAIPGSDPDSAAFWVHCNERRLAFQACRQCDAVTHPPLPVCPFCQSHDMRWVDAPATGRIFTFTWAHTATHPSIAAARLPYNVAVIEFAQLPGVRLISNVVDATEADLRIGDGVVLCWEQAEGQWLPRFRIAG